MTKRDKLEKLQELVIDALIKELEDDNTQNINVANTLLTANKVISQPEEGETQHSKVKRLVKKND